MIKWRTFLVFIFFIYLFFLQLHFRTLTIFRLNYLIVIWKAWNFFKKIIQFQSSLLKKLSVSADFCLEENFVWRFTSWAFFPSWKLYVINIRHCHAINFRYVNSSGVLSLYYSFLINFVCLLFFCLLVCFCFVFVVDL